MKKKDIIIIALALLAALALYLVSQVSLGAEASVVVVTVDGEEVLRKPLAMENRYEIAQDDGSLNVIRVEDGAVFMEEANCRDGLCIRQGKMRNGAKTIVCLPHKVVVQLKGDAPAGDNSDLDVIIQ
ncbi:MAG: NusG domain II-containing protein [Clostridiales bacterium]|nr:NusG domain II-containing protein [Clostridiales bacterium]MCI6589250.1 NusG domain II-containing protein [Clostridiales bacterium]MDY3764078.1 NusG domain II-containing protein [Candidatus Ventricola sp.]MDY4543588.1 NusG domain II-containing protein [Candidatus Ventricola sp.]MDY4854803.1 NusG domain II-containing protein [Candidatus Ventricola sp.]